jgi:transposase-like protein
VAPTLSIVQLADKLRTEADAYKFLEDLRWNGQPACPHCGSADPYFLNPENGKTRTTRTGSQSERRVWKCRACRKQFSVLTGTIFHGTKIPVRTWVFVVFEMASSKNGVAAREIQRKYGLTAKSAWFMLHRVREAMKREPMAGLLSGRVVVDETYIGGKPKNRHRRDPREPDRQTRGPYESDKTAVVALVSRDTGEVRSKVVPNVTGENLGGAIAGEVEVKRTVLHTDGSFRYPRIARHFAGHEYVDHQAGEYVRGDVTTNQAENYFSQLKRSIDGTHHRQRPAPTALPGRVRLPLHPLQGHRHRAHDAARASGPRSPADLHQANRPRATRPHRLLGVDRVSLDDNL